MKTLLTSILFAGVCSATPVEPSQIPESAKWWLHLDLEQAHQTEVGQRLKAVIEEREGAKLQAMKRMFSVNPLVDLKGVTLYGDAGQERNVVLLVGNFDRAHLEDVVAAADEYDSSRHGDLTVHSWVDKGKSQNAAFANDQLLVFSESLEQLELALGTLADRDGLESDPFGRELGSQPVLLGAARVAELELDGEDSKLLRKAKTLKLALGERDGEVGVMVEVGTDGALTGQLVRKVLDGMVAIGRLGDETLAASDLEFETREKDGGRVAAGDLRIPAGDLIRLLEAHGVLPKAGN